MKYWEVIYEDGSHSVMAVHDESAATAALENHHTRARAGNPGGPAGQPAVRVVRVFEYDNDPGYTPENVSVDEAKSTFNEAVKALADENKTVNATELADRMLPRPRVNSAPHESNYRAQESRELDPASWGGGE